MRIHGFIILIDEYAQSEFQAKSFSMTRRGWLLINQMKKHVKKLSIFKKHNSTIDLYTIYTRLLQHGKFFTNTLKNPKLSKKTTAFLIFSILIFPKIPAGLEILKHCNTRCKTELRE